ncbi:MAG TPA: PAS domain S-box protein [Gemmatimonadales bacterium]|nr:PAS domain S-box protein [Gemmatimonadales bacterium]
MAPRSQRDEADRYPPDLVFIVGADGQVLFASREMGGVPADDVVGTSIYDWVFPEQHALVRERLGLAFETGEPQGHELAGFYPHSPDSWYECRIAPNRRDGAVVSVTIVARDVTRHRRAEQEAEHRYAELSRMYEERTADLARATAALADVRRERDSGGRRQMRMLALLDAAGEAMFVSHPETGQILDVNETACRWLQRPRESILGSRAFDLGLGFPIQLTDEQDLQFTETRDSRRPVFVNGVHYRQDGSTFPVETAIARHDLGGGETCILAVVRDVKDRQHSLIALRQREVAYRDLFRLTSDAVYLTTRTGEIVAVNDGCVRLFGYAEDQLIGMDARSLFADAAGIRRFQTAMADKGVAKDIEVDLRTRQGAVLPALMSATRRQSAEGSVQGYQVVVCPRPVAAAGRGSSSHDAARVSAPAAAPPRPVVLAMDPDPETVQAIREVLDRAGFDVLTADGPAHALELLREHAGALRAVVLGAEPGERGVEHTVEEFRRIDPAARIVVSSADDRLALVERLGGLGVAGYVERPFHPLALVQKLRELLAE